MLLTPLMAEMYRDSSIAPLLDLRRGLKAVMDVLDAMIRKGGSLALSFELTVQWVFLLQDQFTLSLRVIFNQFVLEVLVNFVVWWVGSAVG